MEHYYNLGDRKTRCTSTNACNSFIPYNLVQSSEAASESKGIPKLTNAGNPTIGTTAILSIDILAGRNRPTHCNGHRSAHEAQKVISLEASHMMWVICDI